MKEKIGTGTHEKKDNLFSKVFISAFFSYTCVEKNLLSGAGSRDRSRSRLDQLHNSDSTVDHLSVDVFHISTNKRGANGHVTQL